MVVRCGDGPLRAASAIDAAAQAPRRYKKGVALGFVRLGGRARADSSLPLQPLKATFQEASIGCGVMVSLCSSASRLCAELRPRYRGALLAVSTRSARSVGKRVHSDAPERPRREGGRRSTLLKLLAAANNNKEN